MTLTPVAVEKPRWCFISRDVVAGVFEDLFGEIAMGFAHYRVAQLAVGSAIGFFFIAAAPSRAAFIVNIAPDGLGNVVASGTGSIDTTGMTDVITGMVTTTARINPGHSVLVFGTPLAGYTTTQWQSTFTGPASIGTTSSAELPNSTSGTYLFLDPTAFNVSPALGTIYLPATYSSGSSLSETDTWTGTTISNLGLTPGTYQWTWGTAPDADSYTVNISASPVPEPASLSLLGVGATALLGRRRRV